MTTKRWWILGASAAAVVALALVAPVVAFESEGGGKVVVHDTNADVPDCGAVVISGSVTATVRRPVLDLLGLRTVSDVEVVEPEVRSALDPACEGEAESYVATVLLGEPECEASDEWEEATVAFHGCEDGGLVTSMVSPTGEPLAASYGPYVSVARSGLVRGSEWCVSVVAGFEYRVDTTFYSGGETTQSGGICLPL